MASSLEPPVQHPDTALRASKVIQLPVHAVGAGAGECRRVGRGDT